MDRNDALENIAYALKCVAEVAVRRRNAGAVELCEELRIQLENITIEGEGSGAMLRDVSRELRWLTVDLLSAIRFEMREVLIPFIEVKGPTHEFGTLMFPDYFQWLSGEENYVPGDLVKILEEDAEKLLVASEHLKQAQQSRSLTRGRNAHA
jgi:hypothetical protein